MDMIIDRNTVIVDKSPQAQAVSADPSIEKTTNSRSPPSQTQKRNIQEMNEDIRKTHKIYQFQNCGIVYMNSSNVRGVRMKNCGNNLNSPQVTCSLFFLFFFPSHHIIQIIVLLGLWAMGKFYTRNLMQSLVVCGTCAIYHD